jgi:phage terminase large subunit-like protein
MTNWEQIRTKFQSLSLEDKQAFVDNLSDAERLSLYEYPQMFLFDKQIVTGNQNLTLVICGRGWGKQLSLDTELPTPNGFVKLIDLKEGDQLFDEQGNTCNVTKLHPINLSPEAYELEFDDGTKVEACADHLWETQENKEQKPTVKNTRSIFESQNNNHKIINKFNHLFIIKYNLTSKDRFICKVIPIKSKPMRCITVDSPSHLFLITRSFIPTHNTHMGSAWISIKVMEGAKKLAIIAPTYEKDLEQVMVPAILSWFPPGEAKYVGGMIKFNKYDAIIYCYSAETEVRGPNIEYCWCDEIAKWNGGRPDDVSETFKVATTACRIGKNPQVLVTSTPKPFPLIINWEKKCNEGSPLYKMIRGTMYDNPFLSDAYKKFMEEEYKDTPRLMRQELLGEIQGDVEGAAWTTEMIDKCQMSYDEFKAKLNSLTTTTDEHGVMRKKKLFQTMRIVVGVDPTVSDKPDGDECGIIIALLGSDNHVYILNDYSGQYTTGQWAKKAIQALSDYDAGMIVIEKNNGGELITRSLRIEDPSVPIKTVTAAKGKIDRALPISSLYERGEVHHVMPKRNEAQIRANYSPYQKLEYQMTHYTGNPKIKSPDRLDALVWSIHELRLTQTYVNRDMSAIGFY